MAFRKTLIFGIILFLLNGCAQVGQISGGEKDTQAPRPILKNVDPPNGSVFFAAKEINIPFNEFIQLNNPTQNIVIVPNHAQLDVSIHHKTLSIRPVGELRQNTTYVIYMNGVVKDVTEGNDSLMTYVFSTGSFIDSSTYVSHVIDVETCQMVPGITVALYSELDSLKPCYFAKTDQQGEAIFRYIKPGAYSLLGFEDINQDFSPGSTERVAFKNERLFLTDSINDTIPLRLFNPLLPQKITSKQFNAPGKILLETTQPSINPEISINGKLIDTSMIRIDSHNKISVLTDLRAENELNIIFRDHQFTDTLFLRLNQKEKKIALKAEALFSTAHLGPHESLSFKVNDYIDKIDIRKIRVYNQKDSSDIKFEIHRNKDEFLIDINSQLYSGVDIVLEEGAIEGLNEQKNMRQVFSVQIFSEKDYGNIHLKIKGCALPVIVELIQENKIVQASKTNTGELSFKNLMPGIYSFRVIEDSNNNDIFDTGDFKNKIQPETIHIFSKPQRVRANWDLDLELNSD